jgi:DNA-binding CsgD family transcriptional regulator
MSDPTFSDDAILAMHSATDYRGLLRAASELLAPRSGSCALRLLLSRGEGLPVLILALQDGAVTETRLDPRWVQSPFGKKILASSGPLVVPLAAGSGDLPNLIFPDRTDGAVAALPVARPGHFLLVAGPAGLGDDASGLAALGRHFAVVLGRLLAAETDHAVLAALRHFAGHSFVGLIAVSWDLAPLYANRAALQLCGEWLGGDGHKNLKSRVALPEDIFRECLRLKQDFLGRKDHRERTEPSGVVTCPTAPGLRAGIRLVLPPGPGLRRPIFQIRLERPLDGTGVRRRARAQDVRNFLSPSEREILEVAATGLGNEEIAARLGKSVPTVKSQIQSIYRKLSVSNRSELIARISGLSQARAAR